MMCLFNDSYRNKTVLVTGHTGFKGTWLSLWLLKLGAKVVGFSLPVPDERPNFFKLCRLKSKLESHYGDIRDLSHLKKIVHETQPEIIFHLAAQPLVRASYRSPVETFSTNVLGAVYLLEAIRGLKSLRVCQIITSDKCYRNEENQKAFREGDPLGGQDPYSASKASAELIVESYRSSFFPPERISEHGVSLSTIRAGNVIGGGDWGEDRVVPDCIRALSEGKEIPLRNPTSVRPWQYILDVLSGYLMLAERQMSDAGIFANAWNFGPGSENNVTVVELVERVIKNWGRGRWIKLENDLSKESDLAEFNFLSLDASKANQILGWYPVYTLEESIFETVKWYQLFYQKDGTFDAFDFSNQQISDYIEMARHKDCSWILPSGVAR